MRKGNASAERSGIVVADLGGTQLRVTVYNTAGEERYAQSMATPRDRPSALAEALARAVAGVALPVVGAVVGVPGPVDYEAGHAPWLPNLAEWSNGITARELAETLQIPVILANDGDLGALGEHHDGAGRGVDDLVYLTVGTGVGSGVVIGGRLLHGRWSLAEAGHMVIDHRSGASVEDLGAGPALGRLAEMDPRVVVERCRRGDKEALADLRQTADVLAVGLLNLLYCFMPQRAVIGGGLSAAGSLLLEPMRERVGALGRGLSLSVAEIVEAELGDRAGLLGGRTLGRDAFLTDRGSHGLTITPPP